MRKETNCCRTLSSGVRATCLRLSGSKVVGNFFIFLFAMSLESLTFVSEITAKVRKTFYMAKQFASDFQSIMRDIEARRFAPIYVLMGEESYFIDRITDALATSVLPEEEREFNQFVVYGLDASPKQVADMAREFPMMSEYKVIILKEAQSMRDKDLAPLERYLEHPSPQSVVVYCHKNGKVDARRNKKFLARAKEMGVVMESKKVSERDLMSFVRDFLESRGKSIDDRTAAVIASSIGSDLCRLATELDKLCLTMAEDQKVVDARQVEECIGVSREYNPFEFLRAVVDNDFAKAHRILRYFDSNPRSGGVFVLLPTLFNYFQNLMIAHYAKDKSQKGIMDHLELRNSWQANDYMKGVRRFSAMKTMNILAKIRETDEKVKGLGSTAATSHYDLARDLLSFVFF